MKKIFCFVLLSVLFLVSFARSSPAFVSCPDDGFCKLISIGKEVYCVTKYTISKEEKNGLKQLAILPASCNGAVGRGNQICLATEAGIATFSIKDNSIATLLPNSIKGNITHIEADELGSIWFTKEWEGCFKTDGEKSVQQIVKVPVTYSLAHTSDSNIWVGTNVGLYKVPVSGKEIVRYAEEGIADNDLPDNLVEQLYGTGNNIWAVMPGHISHIVPGEEEAPDFENIGNRDNELYDIAQMPLQSFLFATRQGLLYLPNVQNDDRFRTGEIHQEVKETAFHLKDEIIRKPAAVKNEPVIAIQFIDAKAYFITRKGFWSMPSSILVKQIKTRSL